LDEGGEAGVAVFGLAEEMGVVVEETEPAAVKDHAFFDVAGSAFGDDFVEGAERLGFGDGHGLVGGCGRAWEFEEGCEGDEWGAELAAIGGDGRAIGGESARQTREGKELLAMEAADGELEAEGNDGAVLGFDDACNAGLDGEVGMFAGRHRGLGWIWTS
jgi:hypothetical protein